MFEILALMLLFLWLFAVLTTNTLGGAIHIALVLAIAVTIWRLVHMHRLHA